MSVLSRLDILSAEANTPSSILHRFLRVGALYLAVGVAAAIVKLTPAVTVDIALVSSSALFLVSSNKRALSMATAAWVANCDSSVMSCGVKAPLVPAARMLSAPRNSTPHWMGTPSTAASWVDHFSVWPSQFP